MATLSTSDAKYHVLDKTSVSVAAASRKMKTNSLSLFTVIAP